MTEGKRGSGTELGKRFYEMFRNDRERLAGSIAGMEWLSELSVTGGVTHEEALLLLAAPEDIEELVRKKEVSGKGQSSLERLLQWSDEKRSLRVLARADNTEQAAAGKKHGAQGLGLIRGECVLRANASLKGVYHDWLDRKEESEKQHYRLRLISLWTEEWESILQAADGLPSAVSLAWDTEVVCSPETRYDLQDIQLESLYRALAKLHEDGLECQLELLALWPTDSEDFIAAYEFIDEVGRQTLCDLKPSIELKIGALLHPEISPTDAANIARLADIIVMDTEKMTTLHFMDDKGPIGMSWGCEEMKEPIMEWASPALLQCNLEDIIVRIRRIKPQIGIRVSGEVTVSDLRTVLRLGISEVCCAPSSMAAIRLAGIRLEWMHNRLPAVEEA